MKKKKTKTKDLQYTVEKMASFAAKIFIFIFFLKDEFREKSYYFVPHHPFDVRKKKKST